jgi:hypothetical protein
VSWFLTACLWLHVAGASWWILTSITLALVGGVISVESVEGKELLSRVVPGLNRANAVAAIILLATGLVNIFSAGERRNFGFTPAFDWILGAKVVLYGLMVAALTASFGVERGLRDAERGAAPMAAGAGRLVALCALIAVAGAAAMMLGVWLAGE